LISALILAAGQSRRMGRAKMPLAWGTSTVLGHVIDVLRLATIEDILVVTGGDREAVEQIAKFGRARTIFNPNYAGGEMLSSLQVGLEAMPANTEAALIALGDQPQVQEITVRAILLEFSGTAATLVVPSYQMHRGHPWLVARPLWGDVLRMRSPETPRDFLEQHARKIRYIKLDSPTILQDVDTPDDYAHDHPCEGKAD
jgi:molybdenum cofactor cytidylyltransferase